MSSKSRAVADMTNTAAYAAVARTTAAIVATTTTPMRITATIPDTGGSAITTIMASDTATATTTAIIEARRCRDEHPGIAARANATRGHRARTGNRCAQPETSHA